jgi:hypothetical protein
LGRPCAREIPTAENSNGAAAKNTAADLPVLLFTQQYWKIIADNLKRTSFSLGWVSAVDSEGRTIWIVDAHGYGKRFIVRADEMLTAFVELERAIHEFAVSLIS